MTGETADAVHDAETYYDDLAALYPEIATFPIREHATWPATRSLLGDVAGTRLLDAGCGSGEHTARLAADGADVVGVDASEKMLQQARARHQVRGDPDHGDGSLRFLRADLSDGLPFDDGEFDVVCCQLVCSHVPELASLFAEFERVLADGATGGDGGRLVVATHHPLHDFWIAEREAYPRVEVGSTMELDPQVSAHPSPPVYHEDGIVRVQWSEDGLTGTYHRRSVETLVSALLEAGFALDGIEEPVPDEAFREQWPDAFEEFVTRPPEVLCLRGRT